MKFKEIREHYATELPKMMAEYKAIGRMDFDPYTLDFTGDATPIEDKTWSAIRMYSLPFYPQIPALRFFLDFANPFLKIGIECDGKQWHDAEKDAKRDAELEADGWTIYRIPGWKCMKVMDEPWERFYQMAESGDEVTDEFKAEYCMDWFLNTSDGVVMAIGMTHFQRTELGNQEWYRLGANASIKAHRSAQSRNIALQHEAWRGRGGRKWK